MRCAVSIYNPGDVAPVHIHTPNASRTILSESGGYTTIEGERCEAARGDLILTPNGTWHDHGNDGAEPVVWIDVLDFPLMEFLDCVWLDEEFPGETDGNARAQAMTDDRRLFAPALRTGAAWCRALPRTAAVSAVAPRRCSITAAPMCARRSTGCATRLATLTKAITLRFVNPATGASVFPTLDYRRDPAAARRGDPVQARDRQHPLSGHRRQRRDRDRRRPARLAEERHLRRAGLHLAAARQSRRQRRVLYAVSDMPLLEKIGQYRAQGRLPDDTVAELAPG